MRVKPKPKFFGLHFVRCQFSDPLKFDFVIPPIMGTWNLVIPPIKGGGVEFSDPPHGFVSPLPAVVNGHSLKFSVLEVLVWCR